MPQLATNIPSDLDRRFRDAVLKRLGYRKGNIRTAIIDALEAWVRNGDGSARRAKWR